MWPPLGLLYISSFIKKNGYEDVRIIDAFSENIDKSRLLKRIKKERPDVIGMSCAAYTFLDAVSLLEDVKRMLPDTVIVMGGHHATFVSEQILKTYKFIDYVIKGEGELSFLQLIKALEKNSVTKNISGVSYFNKGKFINNNFCQIDNLNSLPFPDRESVINVNYGHRWRKFNLTFGKFSTIVTSRGCPFSCRYCSCSAFANRRWRTRSVDNIADEFEELQSLGYETCVVVDDNFTTDVKRVERICNEITKRKIKMDLLCECRPQNLSLSLLKNMKSVGFSTVYLGIESGMQKILDYYRKGTNIREIRKTVINIKKANMNVIGSFIIGAPIESREDILKTIKFATNLRLTGIQWNILGLTPGTEIWKEYEKKGLIKGDTWKRDHRIYEYCNDHTKEELENLIELGYQNFLNNWLGLDGLRYASHILMTNKAARKVFVRNFCEFIKRPWQLIER